MDRHSDLAQGRQLVCGRTLQLLRLLAQDDRDVGAPVEQPPRGGHSSSAVASAPG
jgi:hypothetical protein